MYQGHMKIPLATWGHLNAIVYDVNKAGVKIVG